MSKSLLGLFAGLVVTAAIVGTILWDFNSHAYDMVMSEEVLKTLMDQQRESFSRDFLTTRSN